MFVTFSGDYIFVGVAMPKACRFIFIDINGHFMEGATQIVIHHHVVEKGALFQNIERAAFLFLRHLKCGLQDLGYKGFL